MRSIFILAVLSLSLLTTSRASADQLQAYEEHWKSRAEGLEKIQADFENPKSARCRKTTASACFQKFVRHYEIQTAAEVVSLAAMASKAALTDQKKQNPLRSTLNVVDNVVTVFESIKLNRFWVYKIKARNAQEESEIQLLRSDEQQRLAEIRLKIIPMARAKFDEADAKMKQGKRGVASAYAVEEKMRKSLGRRLRAIEKIAGIGR